MHLRAFAHLLLIVSSSVPSLSSSELSEDQKEMNGWRDNLLNEAMGKRGMELLVERIAKVHRYCSDHELTPPEQLLALEKMVSECSTGATSHFAEFVAVSNPPFCCSSLFTHDFLIRF